jgi:two-component system, NarL family, invasion response regulator UvrY
MKLLLADDHSVVRKGLNSILLEEYPTATIREVNDGASILAAMHQQEWDLIITDISMPGRSGLEILKDIKQINMHTPVLILSIHTAEQYAIRALKAGASGYLTKESAPEELIKAIRQILSGRKYITAAIAELMADSFKNPEGKELHELLSNREFEVMKLIATGKTISEIGAILSLSVNTISTYRSRILEKMQLSSNAALTKYAVDNKLV